MNKLYTAKSKTNGQEVRLYECNIRKGFTHCIFVNGREYAYLDDFSEAYRLFNDLAR